MPLHADAGPKLVQIQIQDPTLLEDPWQRFQPSIADEGMVSSQEAHATRAGVDMLEQGGNAVDAAVAVGFALAVTLPRAGNLAGGGFMVIWLEKEQKSLVIDYREVAPAGSTQDMFLNELGEVDEKRATESYLAAGVPGTVAGLFEAHRTFGSLPLEVIMQPAIELARKGFPVYPSLSDHLATKREWLWKSVATRRIFFKPDGGFYQPGDILVQEDLAKTLETILKDGEKAFYEGAIADRIAEAMKAHGGLITRQDLADYEIEIRETIQGTYRGHTLLTMPPPSSGGVILLEMLNILEGYPLAQYGSNSSTTLHLMIEAMNRAYFDRSHYLGDPSFADPMPIDRLISKSYAAELRKTIEMHYHTPVDALPCWPFDVEDRGDQTTHYSVVDQHGNMVSNTYTLNYAYGNGYVVPGTGMLLNNEMADFTLKRQQPNHCGWRPGDQNLIEPGKRPLSSMTPTIILDPDGSSFAATGSPGSATIILTVLQVVLNLLEFDFNVATAVSLPRIYSTLSPDEVQAEQGIVRDTWRLLQLMGHTMTTTDGVGASESLTRTPEVLYGAYDPRRSGALAAGY